MTTDESETFTLREMWLCELDVYDHEPCVMCNGDGCAWCDDDGNARGVKRVTRAALATMRTRDDAARNSRRADPSALWSLREKIKFVAALYDPNAAAVAINFASLNVRIL